MSIIVVVKKAGKAVIAADTQHNFGSTNLIASYISKMSKIFRFKDSFIGIVGAPAHDNVLQHLFEKHQSKVSLSSREEIFETYLKVHPILKDEYFLNTDEEENKEYESSQIDGLIANSNGIFGIYSLREVYEFDKFWAIGSGMEYALGAMYATYELFDEPEQIAEIAVKAACEFDDGCGLPLMLHSVILDETKPQSLVKNKGKGTKRS